MDENSREGVVEALCDICKEIAEVVFTDAYGRSHCGECFGRLPASTASLALEYLLLTIPFDVGDRVECRTAGALFDGVGVIDEVSVEPENFGTPAYPSFHVIIEDKAYPEAPDSLWYTETCLKRVSESS